MSDEMNISMTQRTPPRKARHIEVELPIFNKGTPMPREHSRKDWDQWKKNEIRKAMATRKPGCKCVHVPFERQPPCYTKDKLPEKSDNRHLDDRDVYLKQNSAARKHVLNSLVSLNNHGFNCAKADGIAIKHNGEVFPRKACKRFVDGMKKKLKEAGNPDPDDIFSEDEDDKEFNKVWEPQRKQLLKEGFGMVDGEEVFDPWDEFCTEMEDNLKENKIDMKHYLGWLRKKVKDNEVSPFYADYCNELEKTEKQLSKKTKAKKKLKSLVSGVQLFYRKSLERLSGERSRSGSKSDEKISKKSEKSVSKVAKKKAKRDTTSD
ncbi:unnamed protein product [Caenorhabditis angaria]|uniref:Uncharacterized protein n=1 Tax=Caenorhabditis angaria TaxID=860376 RepID=A0A9P1MZQ0_9PELO|nr:unnamed protein product [Caenorhabditis angaria]